MKTLELFSGTQSFSSGVRRAHRRAQTVTVDMSPRYKPTFTADVRAFDYKQFPRGHFDIIWASPPCTEYSCAKTVGKRDLSGADALVRRTWQIIKHLAPRVWIIENVGTGLLVKRMRDIVPSLRPCQFVDYCAFGKPWRKRTALWSNRRLKCLRTCAGAGKCKSMKKGTHKGSVGGGSPLKYTMKRPTLMEKNAIPRALIDALLAEVSK